MESALKQSNIPFLTQKKELFRPAIRSEHGLARLPKDMSRNLRRPRADMVFHLG